MLRLTAAAGLCLTLGCSNTYENKVNKPYTTTAAPVNGATGGYALHVKGMGCPLCATNVRKAIERAPGVESVNIDLGAGVVKVSAKADAAPSENDLRKAVMDAGFQLDRIERAQ
jgi:copper chaperone CopZ